MKCKVSHCVDCNDVVSVGLLHTLVSLIGASAWVHEGQGVAAWISVSTWVHLSAMHPDNEEPCRGSALPAAVIQSMIITYPRTTRSYACDQAASLDSHSMSGMLYILTYACKQGGAAGPVCIAKHQGTLADVHRG